MRKSSPFKIYREAWSGQPPEIWTHAFLMLINRTGTMVIPFLSIYLTTILGFSLKEAGTLVSAFGFGSFSGSFLAGRICDRAGPQVVIFWSLFISGFLLISLQLASGFAALFALIYITALFGEAYRPALMAAIAEYVPKSETGRTVSFLRLAVNLGMSAAPVIGGFTALHLGYNWLFWIDGLTCIAAATYFHLALKSWRAKPRVSQQHENEPGPFAAPPPYRDLRFLFYLGATFFAGIVFLQWFHTVPVFLKTQWAFNENIIGLLLGFNAAMVIFIEMPAIHATEKAGKSRQLLLLGLLCTGIAYLPFLSTAKLLFCFLAMFIWTLGEIFFIPLNNAIALNMSPATRRGEYSAWYWMTWSLASIIAPVFGLGFADEFGFANFWILLAALAGLSFLIYGRLLKKS